MTCPSCNSECGPGARFCSGCGSALTLRCPFCGEEYKPEAKCCAECGTALSGPTSSPNTRTSIAVAEEHISEMAAERRQLTVMFCDIVNSIALSESLDPEDLRDYMRLYQEACSKVIHRFDGFIAKYLGDGLLVHFGYPNAHEDDAQRAVRAGLGMLEAVKFYNYETASGETVPIELRIGVHTGLVVIDEIGAESERKLDAEYRGTTSGSCRTEYTHRQRSHLSSYRGIFRRGISRPQGDKRILDDDRSLSHLKRERSPDEASGQIGWVRTDPDGWTRCGDRTAEGTLEQSGRGRGADCAVVRRGGYR
jgi:hypothetical protein